MFLTKAQIARICHELNRAYCEALGDMTQDPWPIAPEWQRKSALDGVMAIASGDVERPEESHENWLAQKSEEGWKYGPVKDPVAKTHPCMVEFKNLPREQRMKDILFFQTARVLLDG